MVLLGLVLDVELDHDLRILKSWSSRTLILILSLTMTEESSSHGQLDLDFDLDLELDLDVEKVTAVVTRVFDVAQLRPYRNRSKSTC